MISPHQRKILAMMTLRPNSPTMKAAAHPAAFYKHDLAILVDLVGRRILERDSSPSGSIHRSHMSSYGSSLELLRTELN